MSLFAFANLSLAILSAGLAIFILLQARNRTHYIWACFNAMIAVWGLGLFFVGISATERDAIFHWRWTFAFNTFIPILFYHLIHSFCKLKERWILTVIYAEGFLFLPFILFPDCFVKAVDRIYNSIYHFAPNPLYYFWLGLLAFITLLSFVRLFSFVQRVEETEKTEALYLFWGMLFGFLGGFTLALPTIGIHIYPAWHFMICIYAGIITFAILRHHFFDIRVTLTRLLIPIAFFIISVFIFCFFHFHMNLFSFASLSLGLACFLLAYIIACYAKNRMHWIWAVFNVSLSVCGIGTFFVSVSENSNYALIAWKLAYVGVLFVPVLFYHMIYIFCDLRNKKFLDFTYLQGTIVVLLNLLTDHFLGKLVYLFNSFYYHQVTRTYLFFFIIWIFIVVISFWELYKFIHRSAGVKRTQALYLFWGMLLGFFGGTTVVAPAFGILIYPYGHFFICIYAAICTYAIFKYHLMDIRIAVTRIGIFVLVYSLILGFPFGLTFWGKDILVNSFGQYWYWIPIILSTVFATTGPFVYLYLQRKAEKQLLQEEQRIQDLLIQASQGMNTIHNLSKLLKLIIDVVGKTLGINIVKVFLLNREAEEYILKVPEIKNEMVLNADDPLIRLLKEKQYPLAYDEIKMFSNMEDGDTILSEVEIQMKNLSANIIVPIALNNSLIGFLTLGERRSKSMYSKGLLNALSVLGNQAALAIDKCNYIAAETKRLEAEGLKERMVSLDHMASSMAHEIDNPMHIIRQSITFIQNILLRDPRVSMPTETKNDFDDSLSRSLSASKRVSDMIKAILDYSRMGTGQLESIRIRDALDGFMQLIQPQIKEERVHFIEEIEDDLPPVLGDRVQMEEIFMNFVRNSLHAVSRNEEKKISLKIFRKSEDTIRIECTDNGYGIPKEIINDIFLSSMTTKGSSEGTGLGLYRVRKIVDLFRGKVWAESDGLSKGATMIVELPVYENIK